jgi:hypothetical protein
MSRILTITIEDIPIRAELFDTETADALYEAAPFSSEAHVWGEEVYFRTPLLLAREADARDVVEVGELAFWTEGNAIAIGYGPTPASQDGEIRLAAPCNLWGRALDDVKALVNVGEGAMVHVTRED